MSQKKVIHLWHVIVRYLLGVYEHNFCIVIKIRVPAVCSLCHFEQNRTNMRTIKIVGRNHIFSLLCLIKQCITKENAINHKCVMVTKS